MRHVRVKVTAGAPRERVVEVEGVLEVYVKEPPQGGMANRRVAQVLAERFGVPVASVRLVSGFHARGKTFEVKGVS